MTNIRRAVALWLTTCLALLGMSACNDLPTDLGSDFVVDTADTYRLLSSEVPLMLSFDNGRIDTFASGRPLFNAGPLYVGRLADGSEALSILRFATIDDVDDLDLFDPARYTIQSLKLRLQVSTYAIGDTSSDLVDFGVHDLEWRDEETFGAFTTRTQIENRRDAGLPLFAEAEAAHFSGPIAFADSIFAFEVNDISQDLFRDWMRRRSEYVELRKEFEGRGEEPPADDNYGLALLPAEGVNIIRSFATPEISTLEDIPFSQLELVYQHVDSSGVDTLLIEAGNDGSYVATPPAPEKRFVLQGGSAWRYAIQLDFDMIPDLSRVAYAELDLTIDKDLTLEGRGGNGRSNAVTVRASEDGSLVQNTTLSRSVDIQADDSGRYLLTGLQTIIENWLRNGGDEAFLLHTLSSEEQSEMDRLVFYGPDADDASVRPQLKVFYRTRPR